MNYGAFAEYSETYTLDNYDYTVTMTANFVNNKIFMKSKNIYREFDLEEYENFEGDMKDFAESKINELKGD